MFSPDTCAVGVVTKMADVLALVMRFFFVQLLRGATTPARRRCFGLTPHERVRAGTSETANLPTGTDNLVDTIFEGSAGAEQVEHHE